REDGRERPLGPLFREMLWTWQDMTMNRRHALKALAGVALCPFCAATAPAAETHWSYEGAEGPDRWGNLDAGSRVCATGSHQSPLDIGETIGARLPPLKIAWARRADTIANNGHTIQLNCGDGSMLTGPGGSY